MAELWGNHGTQQNVSYAVAKTGSNSQKSDGTPVRLPHKRERASRPTYGYQERDEEKRQEFIKKIERIENMRKVYVAVRPRSSFRSDRTGTKRDEAGFDHREDYPYGYSLKGERCYALKSGKKRKSELAISIKRRSIVGSFDV